MDSRRDSAKVAATARRLFEPDSDHDDKSRSGSLDGVLHWNEGDLQTKEESPPLWEFLLVEARGAIDHLSSSAYPIVCAHSSIPTFLMFGPKSGLFYTCHLVWRTIRATRDERALAARDTFDAKWKARSVIDAAREYFKRRGKQARGFSLANSRNQFTALLASSGFAAGGVDLNSYQSNACQMSGPSGRTSSHSRAISDLKNL